ncbi:MAG: hypothetical protein QF664_07770, partial [Dehalococcoidia bacterium]|nr:hypothetical protein [Dehalococcoidia bacterium]
IAGAGVLAGVLNTGGGSLPAVGSFHVVMLLVLAMAVAGMAAATFVHRFPAAVALADPPPRTDGLAAARD